MKRNAQVIIALIFFGLILFGWGCQTKEVTSAKVYIQQNDWDNAQKQLEAAVEVDPANAEAQYLLGRAYGMKGRFEDMNRAFDASLGAANTFEQQIKFEREKYWVENFNKGVKAFQGDQVDTAIEAFKTSIMVQPEKVESYRNLAASYLRGDNFDEAVAQYKKAIELDEANVETRVNLGIALYNHKDFDKAIEVFEDVLKRDPANADAISTLGLAYDQIGDSEKALSAYQRAIESNPDNLDLVFNFARLFYNKGQYDKAIEQFQRIVDKNADDFEATNSIGDAYLRIAEKHRKTASELEEKKAGDAKIAAEREMAKTNFGKAIPFLEKAVSLKPNDRNLWFNLGVAHLNVGNKDKGESAFAKAEELEKANK